MQLLSSSEYERYKKLSKVKVTLFNNNKDFVVENTKLEQLSIDTARLWLDKVNLGLRSNKQEFDIGVENKNLIKEWLDLKVKYINTISFYPKGLYTKYLEEYILDSNILGDLISLSEVEYKNKLREYWVAKSKIDPHTLTLQQILDIGRVLKVLDLGLNNYVEFIELLDLEYCHGYSKEYSEKFYTLFKYLKLINSSNWVYSSREIKLIESSITVWKHWLLLRKVDVNKLTALTIKYLDIDIPSTFIDIIWLNKPYDLTKLGSYWNVEPIIINNLTDKLTMLQIHSFNLLECTVEDTIDTVKQKYYTLVKEVHPDLAINPDEVRTKELNLAWETLKQYYAKKYHSV